MMLTTALSTTLSVPWEFDQLLMARVVNSQVNIRLLETFEPYLKVRRL